MGLVTPDFSEVADDIEEGTYQVQIVASEVKSDKNDAPYVAWTFETVGADDKKNNGRKIKYNTWTRGGSAFKLAGLYKAAVGEPCTSKFDTEQLHSKQVVIKLIAGVNRQTGEPTGFMEVKSVRPAG